MNRKTGIIIAVILLCGFATGCASQTRTEMEFGDAVRAVNSSQVHDKVAGSSPGSEAVTGGDPYRLEAVVTSHRGDVSQPEQVSAPVEASVRSTSRRR